MNNPFTVEEANLICIFQSDSRTKVIKDIHKAVGHIDDDDLVELSVRVVKKLENMSDRWHCSLLRKGGKIRGRKSATFRSSRYEWKRTWCIGRSS